jgi:hypothetical protein
MKEEIAIYIYIYLSIVTVVATRKVADDTTRESHSDRLFLLFLPTVKL